MKSAFAFFQPLGRALMLPIAVLPVAGMLLRLGQPDLLNIAFLSAAGDAIFAHLGLLFAVGVATGFAKDGNGAACLAGVTCYLIAERGAQALLIVPTDTLKGVAATLVTVVEASYREQAIAKLDVPIGIVSGLIGGTFYNRFSSVPMPEYLAFFGGRRFVPIVSGLAGLGLAALLGFGFGQISAGIDAASRGIVNAGGLGLFAYGMLNRLLLVTGLHHILNNVAWFVVGDFRGTNGDLRRFFAGDPSAGAFMSGFFPVMMFGLPAACLAMYHEALPARRKAVAGMFTSLALTSFLTGVTEPIEFSFMFVAPFLYVIHAVLTGLAMALMHLLDVHLGFGFSAGLFDYLLNYGKSSRPLLLLPIGAIYAGVYYGLFRLAIRRFDLKTPGRELEGEAPMAQVSGEGQASRGAEFLVALGGAANIVSVDACTTRLRLAVRDHTALDEARLKALGARGIVRPSPTAAQIVLGPIADAVAMDIRAAMGIVIQSGPRATHAAIASDHLFPTADTIAPTAVSKDLITALGGPDNVRSVRAVHERLCIEVADNSLVQMDKVSAFSRGAAFADTSVVHVLTPAKSYGR